MDSQRSTAAEPDDPRASAPEPLGVAGVGSGVLSGVVSAVGDVSAREAAAHLGLHERTVRRAIRRGDLAAERAGRSFRITADELDRYRRHRLAARRPAPRPLLLLVPDPAPLPSTRPRLALHHEPATSFVGREREAASLVELLVGGARLVTLTGPGGVGKTRLAFKAAADAAAAFADGVALVALAAVRDPGLVLPTVALVIGARDGSETSTRERLTDFLADREVLLLLDNMEQVTAAGPAVADLVRACPGLTVLVTSRAPLRLAGERVVAVPPLGLPDPPTEGLGPVLAPVAEAEAVRLFVERARAATGAFALTEANAPAVAALCRRLDGLPLAIELAAARTRHASPRDLLDRLIPALPLLQDGPRDAPDRLRTMRQAIAWSYDLLSDDEQDLFRRLAVFAGGFTLDACEWVAGGGKDGEPAPDGSESRPRRPPAATLDRLAALVDESLVRWGETPDGRARYTILETIREFGLERLAAGGDDAAARGALAGWCVAFAEQAEPELAGSDQDAWVARIEAELGNVRVALDWLVGQGEAERALRLAGALGWFWSSAPYLHEGRDRFDAVLALPGVERYPAALAKALASAGDIADWQGDQPRTRAHYERALALYRRLGDRGRGAGMLRGLGSSAVDRGELDLAHALLEEGLAEAEAIGNAWEAAAAMNLLGVVASIRGDFSAALARHEAATARWRRLGDTGHVVTGLTSAAWVALLDRSWARAATAYGEGLELALAAGDPWYAAWCVIGAGALAARRDPPTAAALLGFGLGQRERLGVGLRPHNERALDRIVAAVRADLGAAFAEAWQAGRALPLAAAAERARGVFAETTREPDAGGTRSAAPYGLTQRERDTLRLLAQGRPDKEIAEALFVTRRSASKYVSAVLAKLGVPSRTAAAALALRDHLV